MMIRLFACLLLVITSTPLLAQSWYQVNIVVFENRAAVDGGEILQQPDGVQFALPDNAVEIDAIAESGDANGFQRTTILDTEFNSVVASLQRSSGYKVLLVKSWRQPGLERGKAIPVVVRGGATYGPHSQLEGTIRLVLSRYLHLETDLWLGEYTQEQPLAPTEVATDALQIPQDRPTIDASLTPEGTTPESAESLYVPLRLVHLQESRRMRSKELHYIDHPQIGVVAKIIPLR